ncbi:MAG: metallophosphoesterase [Lachnospiraceae bacterium]|nr:metallophosphoesterase [Lachnospiraceae bacterium]
MRSFVTEHYEADLSGKPYSANVPEKIAVVSDLHNTLHGTRNEKLLEAIRSEQPDVIVIPGDLVTNASKKNRVAYTFLKDLSELGMPVYYGVGNHEEKFRKRDPERFEKYLEAVKKLGIIYLDNAFAEYSDGVFFGGLTIPFDCYKKGPQMHRLTIRDVHNCIPNVPDGLRFVMCHNPVWFPVYEEGGFDVVFSGHVHGGIIRLPFFGGLISPQWKLFPKYDAGKFAIGNSLMFVSRGLGSHTIRLRFRNKPELMIVHCKK